MNLTPEQLELLYCLLGALAIGYLFGYFYKRASAYKKHGKEIRELNHILDTREIEIETVSAKHGQLKQHMAVQANELKTLNQQVVNLQENMSTIDGKSQLLHDENHELSTLVQEKTVHLQESKKDLDKLHQEIEFTKSELSESQNLLHEYKTINNTQNEKLLAVQAEIEQKEALTHEIDMLKKALHEKEHAIGELKSKTVKLDQLQQENQKLKVTVDDTTKALEQSKQKSTQNLTTNTNLDALNQKYTLMQKELEDTKKELKLKGTSIINLEKEREDLQEQVKSVKNNVVDSSAVEKELQMLKVELSDRDKMLSNKDKILKATQDKLVESEIKNKEYQSKPQVNVSNKQNASYLSEKNEKKGWSSKITSLFGKRENNNKK